MEFDLHTFIFTILNFIILLLVLRHLLFKPMNNILTSRQNEVDAQIKDAEENQIKAEQYRTESEQNLKESRERGKVIVEDQKKKAEKLSEEILGDANSEAQQIINRAMKEAEREKEKAEDEIKQHVVDLAVLLSSKALEKSINEEEHRRLINDFIAKVGI